MARYCLGTEHPPKAKTTKTQAQRRMVVMGPRYHTGKKTRPSKVTIAARKPSASARKKVCFGLRLFPLRSGTQDGGEGPKRLGQSSLAALLAAKWAKRQDQRAVEQPERQEQTGR